MASPREIEVRMRDAINLALQDSKTLVKTTITEALVEFFEKEAKHAQEIFPEIVQALKGMVSGWFSTIFAPVPVSVPVPVPVPLVPVPFCKDCEHECPVNGSGGRSCDHLYVTSRPTWLDVEHHFCIFQNSGNFFKPKEVPP